MSVVATRPGGLVASVHIVGKKLVTIGDWIEMLSAAHHPLPHGRTALDSHADGDGRISKQVPITSIAVGRCGRISVSTVAGTTRLLAVGIPLAALSFAATSGTPARLPATSFLTGLAASSVAGALRW